MLHDLVLFLIGAFAGISGSIVGLGGGFIIVPCLTFLFPSMPPSHIVGTSMAVLLFNSLSSTLTYSRQKRIDYKAGVWFAIASIPGSILGADVAVHMGKGFFIAFGGFLILISLFLIFKPKKPVRLPLPITVDRKFVDATGTEFAYSYNLWVGVVISLFVGFLASLFGIGGGSLLVPTMTLLLSFPAHIASATSMLAIFISAIFGTASHAHFGDVDWWKVLFLAPGALIGGPIGARLALRLPAKLLLRVLACLLILVAIRMMTQ